jgi:hypothetical protein
MVAAADHPFVVSVYRREGVWFVCVSGGGGGDEGEGVVILAFIQVGIILKYGKGRNKCSE